MLSDDEASFRSRIIHGPKHISPLKMDASVGNMTKFNLFCAGLYIGCQSHQYIYCKSWDTLVVTVSQGQLTAPPALETLDAASEALGSECSAHLMLIQEA